MPVDHHRIDAEIASEPSHGQCVDTVVVHDLHGGVQDRALTGTFTGHGCVFRVEAAGIAGFCGHCLREGEDVRLEALDIVVHGFHVLGGVVSRVVLIEILVDQKTECRAVSLIQGRLILIEQPCCLRVGDFQVGWRE